MFVHSLLTAAASDSAFVQRHEDLLQQCRMALHSAIAGIRIRHTMQISQGGKFLQLIQIL